MHIAHGVLRQKFRRKWLELYGKVFFPEAGIVVGSEYLHLARTITQDWTPTGLKWVQYRLLVDPALPSINPKHKQREESREGLTKNELIVIEYRHIRKFPGH